MQNIAKIRRTFGRDARCFPMIATFCIVALAMCPLAMRSARAQTVANVSSVQRITEKKAGLSPWRPAGNGTALKIDDAFRTGKRSKADIKFTDGSLLRLGQLSSVEFKSAKGVRLLGGQLLYTALKPGRVLAGTAAAEIKGSVVSVRLNVDGSADIELYSGAVDVVSPMGTISLKPGQGVTVGADGKISPVRAASPRVFLRGSSRSELLDKPNDTPFAGSRENELIRIQPERLALEEYESVSENLPITNGGNPFIIKDTRRSPFPPPIPTTLPPAPRALNERSAPTVLATRQTPTGAPGDATNVSPDIARGTDIANDVTDTGAAEHHLEQGNRTLGNTFGGDAFAIGVLSDSADLYGGRIHGYGARGKLYFDVAIQPLRARINGGNVDYSSMPSAYALYRDKWGDVQFGRQRFVGGPTQATLFGSMVRAGTREVMDAVRFAPALKNGKRLEVAYIYDAFVRNLPYKLGGPQHAAYGRFSMERKYANLGLNVLRYSSAPVDSTTGVTLDFALPVVRNKIEFYGEVGRDPFRRKLTTVGLTFPGIYQRTGFDAFLEYANLQGSSSAARVPTELALRVYKRVGRNLNVVSSVSRFYGTDTNFTLGLAYGTRFSKTGDSYGAAEQH